MARVGDYIIKRHGDGLWRASYMGYEATPGYHSKSKARLHAKLLERGVAAKDIVLDAPGAW